MDHTPPASEGPCTWSYPFHRFTLYSSYGMCLFLEWHSKTQTLTTRTHAHPYEYMYANPTPMSTSEWLSTGRSGDFRSHQWRLVVDRNVAYHLTHNAGKSWKIQEKVRAPRFEPWWVASHWTVLPLDYKPNRSYGMCLSISCRRHGWCLAGLQPRTRQPSWNFIWAWPIKI
jgi:hypothetical protein